MRDVSRFGKRKGIGRKESGMDVDALVAEVLRRISLQSSGVAHDVDNGKTKRGRKFTRSAGMLAISTSVEESAEPSFKEYPQFDNCNSAEARSLLAYKYLRANVFDVDNAVKMINETRDFRNQHRLDSTVLFPSLIPLRGFTDEEICNTLCLPMANDSAMGPASIRNAPQGDGEAEYLNNHHILGPIVSLINRFYANSIHHCDKEGHPVMYGRLGDMNIRELYNELRRISPLRKQPEDLILLFHLYCNELLWRVVQYCGSKTENSNETMGRKVGLEKIISTTTVIMDCKGLSMTDMITEPFPAIFRGILDLDRSYYPDSLHKLFLVNCPARLSFVHWVSKHLGARKKGLWRKIHCVSEINTPSALREIISEEKLPTFLGGKCNCEGLCVPLNEGNQWRSGSSFPISRVPTNATDFPIDNPDNLPDLCGEFRDRESGDFGFIVEEGTQDVIVRAFRKHTLTYEVEPFEDVTWEFVVEPEEIKFTALFIACSAQGETEVLVPLSKVKEGAKHFVSKSRGELLLTWDNTGSFFRKRKIQLRVHRAPRRQAS